MIFFFCVQFFKRAFEKTTFSNARLKKKKKTPFFFYARPAFRTRVFFFFFARFFFFFMCAFSDFGFARFRFSNARSKPMTMQLKKKWRFAQKLWQHTTRGYTTPTIYQKKGSSCKVEPILGSTLIQTHFFKKKIGFVLNLVVRDPSYPTMGALGDCRHSRKRKKIKIDF